ncbi:hypothetical protein UFOVP665_36 [uncultured Caudovirales phage]|uniref:Uncharacterized protein n=1 Tax=uncultured Caudovirales phage TaxID=2100421 RepID=A0A6J5NB64_9CAUD|nr:hypothetical protein UFOVP665_36 [uncultured Caudovirales phage]
MSVTVKLSDRGMKEIRLALIADAEGITRALNAGLYNMAEDILAESQNLVPFDEGILAGSKTQQEVKGASKYSIAVGYDAAYALVQHERLDFYHPPKPPNKSKVGKRSGTGPGIDPATGRGPKYLERPFQKFTKNYARILTAYVRKHYQAGTSR